MVSILVLSYGVLITLRMVCFIIAKKNTESTNYEHCHQETSTNSC